jgi:lysophospholipase L1-like esterase
MRLLALVIAVSFAGVTLACAAARPEAPAPAAPSEPTATATFVAPEVRRVVAIGDSIIGTGVQAPRGWVRQYAEASGAELVNLATNGWHTQEILRALVHDDDVRESVSSASVIALNAGMNDFFSGRDLYTRGECGGSTNERCLDHMVARFERFWTAIIDELRTLAPGAQVLVANLYHPLEAYDQHFGWADVVNEHIDEMNRHVEATEGVILIDLRTAFNGETGGDDPIEKGYILPDAIHATDIAHDLIARMAITAGEQASRAR